MLTDARAEWKQAYKAYSEHDGTSESRQEAQARERYFNAKSDTQAVLGNLRSVLNPQ